MSEIHTPTPPQPSLTWAFIGQAYAPVSIPPKGYGAVESIIWVAAIYGKMARLNFRGRLPRIRPRFPTQP